MGLGFASAILPDLDFDALLQFTKENKFDCLEVMCWPKGKAERRYAGVTHIDVENLTKEKKEEIQNKTRKADVSISSLGYYPNPLTPDSEERKLYVSHIKRVVSAAKDLGVDTVCTFIGRNPVSSVKDNMKEFSRVWPDIIKFAEDNDIRIAIENCPMLFTMDEWPGGKNLATTPAIWEEMFGLIDSANFGLNYDPSHFIWQQIDYIKPLSTFKHKLFQVHLKDIKINRSRLNNVGIMAPPLEYIDPRIPGRGDIDWKAFLDTLKNIGYNRNLVIEVEDKDFEDSLENRKRAILQSKEYILPFLK